MKNTNVHKHFGKINIHIFGSRKKNCITKNKQQQERGHLRGHYYFTWISLTICMKIT